MVGVLIVGLLLVTGCAASLFTKNETPGRHFDRAMKEFAAHCAKTKLKPNDTACDILKLRPADPLATEEGRFAHSIKIPNPVPADSGYRPDMTPQEYFDHLCKTEAGEFIYRTVEGDEPNTLRRSHFSRVLPFREDLWVIEVVVPTEQEDEARVRLFDAIASTFAPV